MPLGWLVIPTQFLQSHGTLSNPYLQNKLWQSHSKFSPDETWDYRLVLPIDIALLPVDIAFKLCISLNHHIAFFFSYTLHLTARIFFMQVISFYFSEVGTVISWELVLQSLPLTCLCNHFLCRSLSNDCSVQYSSWRALEQIWKKLSDVIFLSNLCIGSLLFRPGYLVCQGGSR